MGALNTIKKVLNSSRGNEGPCGRPGYPSCNEELKSMAKKQGYKRVISIACSLVANAKPQKRWAFFVDRGGEQSRSSRNTRRIGQFTNDPGYKALVSNCYIGEQNRTIYWKTQVQIRGSIKLILVTIKPSMGEVSELLKEESNWI